MDICSCRKIKLPKIADMRGNITFIEGNRHIPFDIKRVYYLYDVPSGELRGGHAHKTLEQFLISTSGSFDVIVDNGRASKKFHLNRPYFGLYLPPMTWRELKNFSSGSVCLVLASDYYNEDDYIRDHKQFISKY
jgi:dTDP-4-dehydrorhamnose 3,5-epimerase-like enzyme